MGCDQSSEPSQRSLVGRVPDSHRNLDCHICGSLVVGWNCWECGCGAALAPLELVPEAAQDRLHVAIPSSPIRPGHDEEAREDQRMTFTAQRLLDTPPSWL